MLANDRDPDGDRMRVGIVEPLPPGIEVTVSGDELEVIARAGARRLTPFTYTVDDGHGHAVRGSVLVVPIADVEPNRPPIANADTATAVAGTSTTIDVLANDIDPDGDPMFVTVGRPARRQRTGSARSQVSGNRSSTSPARSGPTTTPCSIVSPT